MNTESRKKIVMFLLIGILLIVTITGGLVYFLLDKKDDDKPVESTFLYNVKIDDNTLKVYSDKLVYNAKDMKYSKENVDKFKDFMAKEYNTKNDIVIEYEDLDAYQTLLMLCFMNNLSDAEFEVAVEEYAYKVDLKYGNNDYVIYLKENNLVRVKKVKISDDGIDILKVDNTFDLNFSKENNVLVTDYIKSLFNEKDNVRESAKVGVRKDEKYVVDSIVNNDEYYLKKDSVKLLYTMSYSGINCPTPILYLYSDNTFEYYNTFATDNMDLVPKIGTYNIDINNLINEATDDYDSPVGIYTLNDVVNDEYYYINILSTAAKELLTQTNANLATCLVQQGFED